MRPLRENDAPALHAMWNETLIRRSLREGSRIRTLEDAYAYIHFARGRASSGRDMAIVYGGAFAGCISWEYGSGVFKGVAELSYWVGKPYRKRDIASRAIIQANRFLFETQDMRRICAQVSADNRASCRALEKAGFTLEACLQSALLIENQIIDCNIYAVLRASWLALQNDGFSFNKI